MVTQLIATLNTPNLATKKIILDSLVFYIYFSHGDALSLVFQGLENLTNENHERGNAYTYWFKSLEHALSGRGKMGTVVGASEEVKRLGQLDGSLSDFTVSGVTFFSNRGLTSCDTGEQPHSNQRNLRIHDRPESSGAPPVDDGGFWPTADPDAV